MLGKIVFLRVPLMCSLSRVLLVYSFLYVPHHLSEYLAKAYSEDRNY